jgi:hypothetical protein
MELRCYLDGEPLTADENAVLAKRREGGAPATAAERLVSGGDVRAMFHVDCFPADSDEWVVVGRGLAGKLHDSPP